MNYKFADDKAHHETVCEVHDAVSTTGPTSPGHPLQGPSKPTSRENFQVSHKEINLYSHWPQKYFLGRLLLGDLSDVMEKA